MYTNFEPRVRPGPVREGINKKESRTPRLYYGSISASPTTSRIKMARLMILAAHRVPALVDRLEQRPLIMGSLFSVQALVSRFFPGQKVNIARKKEKLPVKIRR